MKAMGLTALQVHGEGLGAAGVGEYRGATTAARFDDPQAEFTALHSGCGVYDLGFRAKISLTGGDRVRWANGMVTNDIRDLAVGQGVYAFLLNPQGHILGDLYAYNRGESIIVDTDVSQVEKILATFDHYIIMDDVQVERLGGGSTLPTADHGAPDAVRREGEEITALGVAGPKTQEVLQKAGFKFPELQPLQLHTMQCDCDCACPMCTIVRGDDPAGESYEVWLAPQHVRPLWDSLLAAGATPVGYEALEIDRIASGIPRYGVDIRERDLPQETEQARALNFNKGCYIGQEIVERIRSRGAVHRKFAGFLAEGVASIGAGARIVVGEKEVGEITSSASMRLAEADKTVALGYIRREAGVPGREVTIGETKAMVTQLPVTDGAIEQEISLARHRA